MQHSATHLCLAHVHSKVSILSSGEQSGKRKRWGERVAHCNSLQHTATQLCLAECAGHRECVQQAEIAERFGGKDRQDAECIICGHIRTCCRVSCIVMQCDAVWRAAIHRNSCHTANTTHALSMCIEYTTSMHLHILMEVHMQSCVSLHTPTHAPTHARSHAHTRSRMRHICRRHHLSCERPAPNIVQPCGSPSSHALRSCTNY